MAVQPLGGKVSTGQTSDEHKAEFARFETFKLGLRELGAVNSEAKSREYRRLLVEYQPERLKTFREIGLDV